MHGHKRCTRVSLKEEKSVLCSVLSDPMSVTRQAPLCPWNSPGKNTGEGSQPFPSQGIFPDPGIRTQVFYIAGRFFTIWATREAWRKRGGEAKRRSQSLLCFLWEKQGAERQTLGYLSNSSELWGTGLSLLSGIWYWDDLGQAKYWLCMWLLPQGGGWWCGVRIGWFV